VTFVSFVLELSFVASVRLDTWLDVACLFKTRSEASKACKLGKVVVNGVAAKSHRDVKEGDEIEIQRPFGRKQLITVLGVTDKHLAKAEARLLYEDRTPKPTPEEIEIRRLERIYRAAATPPTRPERNQRRTLRRLKRGE
jgi:ribosome-associated heat shock protein Hsp15